MLHKLDDTLVGEDEWMAMIRHDGVVLHDAVQMLAPRMMCVMQQMLNSLRDAITTMIPRVCAPLLKKKNMHDEGFKFFLVEVIGRLHIGQTP